MASAVWAGVTDVNSTHRIADIEDANATVRSELERIGYLGAISAHYTATPMAAHFELHIGMKSGVLPNCDHMLTELFRARAHSGGIQPTHRCCPGSPGQQMVHHHRWGPRQPYRSH